ncbi:site-specific DNA-methyltransferase [Verrucomicrobiaceae bacterium R5-34]|uniref:Methyltransferase n=1 Tax=Oceaniferula flava TaxID=2800421 RepID=A0AAE2SEH9_9BACT|nr:site-specific DNA-methyltransferase [Oceaniferula flavus]MBK1831275.1 site-specific DNA-methyltransferase [Verrucomicrobiaceae bacterium R5-34]MBK1855444.1 site-specific DNA-methyltransferase [Oceaniferula flavus]MBM1136750.1 site-specific DNA-methyltransferase [Oceaniferula flavus]
MTTNVELHHGDCLQGMGQLPAGQVDLVVTSPPYNLGIDYNTYRDTSERQAFIAWCLEWAAEVKRVMADDASFFLNVGAVPKNPLLPHQLLLALTDGDDPLFILQNTFHWVKSISVETRGGDTISTGHFKPINSKRYVNDCHEYVFHLTKSGEVTLDRKGAGVPYVHKSNISRWGHTEGEDKRCRGNTWFIPYDTIKNRSRDRPHPATFPVGLVQQCIRIHGKGENTHLLDPFNGIGTSALAAVRSGIISYTGFDIDADYLDVTRERLRAEHEEPAETT